MGMIKHQSEEKSGYMSIGVITSRDNENLNSPPALSRLPNSRAVRLLVGRSQCQISSD